MALIIKGDMPKACAWYDEEGHCIRCFNYGACPYEKIDCFPKRPPRCPIIGEIPDEHGRLKDESVIIENMGNAFEKLFPLDGKHKQTIVSDCHVEFMRAVFKAPVVVEASTEGEDKT